MELSNITILIPTLDPTEKILDVVENLKRIGFCKFVFVNDGSSKEKTVIFDELKKTGVVLNHAINLGKGRALKTGFNYILNEMETDGVLTCDDDGQHTPEDIKLVAECMVENKDEVILGTRNFKEKSIPLKSRFGNVLTKGILSFLIGLDISDTQTGLRAIPRTHLSVLLNTPGERYEYETNMLIEFKNQNIRLRELEIQTIYLDGNKLSHFNPLTDSIKIYSIFFKYIFSSLFSFLVDILLFKLLFNLFNGSILIGSVFARAVSSFTNYWINRKIVFKHSSKFSVLKYYLLVAIQLTLSIMLVEYIYGYFRSNEVLIKVIVDAVLFLASYKIQHIFIFRRKK